MDSKNNTLYPLIILFFLLGIVVGYVIHKPETRIEYVNKTIEVASTPTIKEVEKIVYVTATPTYVAPAATIVTANFSVKVYNPDTDKPTNTMELTNRRFNPQTLSIPTGGTVLIKISDYSLQSPLILTLDSYEMSLGTSGAVVVTFNKKGIYNLKAVISSGDPNVIPQTYGEAVVTVS
ncbi:Uncharacterised protein [uncultured archaeon]|nr:Uncharacterised protein [uncultured archaeon]